MAGSAVELSGLAHDRIDDSPGEVALGVQDAPGQVECGIRDLVDRRSSRGDGLLPEVRQGFAHTVDPLLRDIDDGRLIRVYCVQDVVLGLEDAAAGLR